MAQDSGKKSFRIRTGKRELIGMADAARLYLDQHLAGPGPLELYGLDRERLARPVGDCGFDFHDSILAKGKQHEAR
jgi:hypothetical protein